MSFSEPVITPAAFKLLQDRLDAVSGAAAAIASEHGALTWETLEQGLKEVAESGRMQIAVKPPRVPDELRYWLERRLFRLRVRVCNIAQERSMQSASDGGKVSPAIMTAAWDLVWSNVSLRKQSLAPVSNAAIAV
jgi:hypothetical protein